MARAAPPKSMKRPGAMGDCGVGESTTFGALLTRRTPEGMVR